MSRQSDPWPSLRRRIEKIEAWMKEKGSFFFNTGIHPDGDGGMTVEGKLNVTSGEVQSGDYVPGSKGWHLGSDGKAEFKDVTLYDIPNSMLANPVQAAVADVRVSNFAVAGGAYALLGQKTVPVPAGFTTLLVTATGWMFARNPNTTGGVDGTGTDAIYCFVRVNGIDGSSDSTPYGQGISGFGGFTTATSGVSALKTGLSENVTLQIWGGSTMQALPADAQNSATLSATLLWLR